MVKILKGDGSAVLVGFIGAIIAIAMLASIATSVIGQTGSEFYPNRSVSVPGSGLTTDMDGRELVGTAVVQNDTGGDLTQRNVSIITGTGTDGLRSVQIYCNTTCIDTGLSANASYTMLPDGYLSLSGARSVHNLVPLFSALAILVFVLVVFIARGSLGEMLKDTFMRNR